MESVVHALLEAGWNYELTDRRSKLWDLRIQGVPMREAAKRLGVCKRTAYADWAEMKPFLVEAMAEQIEEVRAKAAARADHLFSVAMAAIVKATDKPNGEGLPLLPGLIQAALRANHELASVIPGVIQSKHELTGAGGGPIEILHLEDMSDDELRAAIAEENEDIERLIEASRTPPEGHGGNGDGRDGGNGTSPEGH